MEGVKLVMKKTNYFSHDSNARNDSKIIPLRMKLGIEGYGIYFMIIERLREESNYTCLKDYDGLAFDFRTTKEKIKSVIEDFDLFEFTDDGYFYSKSLKQRMLIKDEKSKKRSEAGVLGNEKRWKKSEKTPIENQPVISKVSQCDENSSQVKESKVKESKVKESKGKKSKVTHIKKSENFSENFDEVEVEEIPTLETEKEIPLQKSSAKKVSPDKDVFIENLSRFQNDYPNTKRFQEICMFNNKPEEFMLKLFDEFIEDNRKSREHATKEDYSYFYQSIDKHFFYWAKAKISKPTTQTKREQQSEIYKAINEGKSINEILGV